MYFLEEVVLPPGEKVRRIRSYLGLKQHDITGGKVTRNLISYIENGKTKLVRDTAKIVVDCMKEWADKKKIPLDIDVEYIMRSEIVQAKILVEKYINNLREYINHQNEEFENELNRAEEILRMWDITDKKAEIYEIAGDYYYKREQFDESYMNYLKSLESYIRTSDHLKKALIYSKLGRCAIWLNNYHEAINLNNYSLLILEDYNISDNSIVKRALFNNALAYKNLEEYDKCLSLLERLEASMTENLRKPENLDILLLKGNCYFGEENYILAEKIYKQIIDIVDKRDSTAIEAIAYLNLGDIYFKYKEIEKSIENINKSIEIRLNNENFYNNSFYLSNTYLSLGKKYNEIGNYDLAEKYLKKALQGAKEKNDLLLQGDIYKELLNCYMYYDKNGSIDELLGEAKDIFTRNSEMNQMKDIFFQAGYYYIDKDIDKSKGLLKFALNKVN